nr:hypothetical protein CFP56_24958 [Quercus suber]
MTLVKTQSSSCCKDKEAIFDPPATRDVGEEATYSEFDHSNEEEAQRDPDSECAPLINPWYDVHPHLPKIPDNYVPPPSGRVWLALCWRNLDVSWALLASSIPNQVIRQGISLPVPIHFEFGFESDFLLAFRWSSLKPIDYSMVKSFDEGITYLAAANAGWLPYLADEGIRFVHYPTNRVREQFGLDQDILDDLSFLMESPTSVRPFLWHTAFEFWSQHFTAVTVPGLLRKGLYTPAMHGYWQAVMTLFE